MKRWIFFVLTVLSLTAPAAHSQNWNAISIDSRNIVQWDEAAARAYEQPAAESTAPYGDRWCKPTGWKIDSGQTFLGSDGHTFHRGMNAYSNCNSPQEMYGVFLSATYRVYTCVNGSRWSWFQPARAWLCQVGYYVNLQGNNPSAGDCSCDQGRVATQYPIELGTGNMSESATDFSSGDGRLRLDRHYNSNPENPMVAGRGWKNAFEARRIVTLEAMAKSILPGASVAYATSSSTYSTASDACVKGVADVAQVGQGANPPNPKFRGVTGTYLGNGQCQLSSGDVIPVLSTDGSVMYAGAVSDAVGSVVVLRPDGNSYTFNCVNGACHSVGQGRLRLSATVEGFVLTAQDGDVETYDTNGALQSIVSQDGYTLTLSHNTDGTIHTVTDNHGRQLLFGYNGNGLLGTLTLPDHAQVAYGYDAGGRLTSVTYADSSVVQYQYGNATFLDALTAWIDESNAAYVTWQYDSTTGKAISSALAGNVDTSTLSYSGNATTVTDNLGTSRTYHFQDIAGGMRLMSIDGPECGGCVGQSMTYDGNGYLQSARDWVGNQAMFMFDDTGLLSSRTEAVGKPEQRRIDIEWNTSLRVPLSRTVSDAGSHPLTLEKWAYNVRGQPLAYCEIDPAIAGSYTCSASGSAPAGVRRRLYTYCDSVGSGCPLVGLQLTETGPRADISQVTTYSYYDSSSTQGCGTPGSACHQAGDLYRVTNALGQYTTYASYDSNGRVTRITDANGINKDMTYTPRGWLATLTVDGATNTFSYTPYGAVSSVKDPDGVTTSFVYDAAHRLTEVTDGAGNRYHYTLDAAGNRTKEQVFSATNTVERTTSQNFNTLGQLTAIKDGFDRPVFSATYTDSYDANGNLVHSQDGLGIQRKQAFDGLDRLVSTLQNYQGADTATRNTQSVTTYDALDRVTGFSDPDGLNTTYDIDAFGNITGLHSPDTGTTTSSFDIAGNRVASLDANNIGATSTFDALGRILSTSYADTSQNVQYKYDEDDSVTGCTGNLSKGHLTRIVEGSGGIAWCFDARGNVVRKQQTIGTATTTMSYTWTPGNRLSSITTPNGTLITYTRDTTGNITAVTATPQGGTPTTVASNVTYKAFGPIASYQLGDGQTVTLSYDATGSLTDIDSTAFSLHVKRDVVGNITALGDTAGVATPTETYGYDSLYRLTGVWNPIGGAIESYSYNRTGDRLSKTGPGILTGAYTYAPGTHHLTGVGTTTREVDPRGNTTASVLASGTYGFGYNQRNRLTVVQKDGVTVGEYVLNALGQRVQKAAGVSTRFDYDESSRLLSESTGITSRDYIWLGGVPVGTVDRDGTTSTVAYVHADGLGTPRVVTDAAGSVIWQWAYSSNPFGEAAPTSTSGYELNLRFPGQYFDAESSLAYNANRDYDSPSGRYVQSDPLGVSAGPATYLYVGGNALRNTDRFGLDYAQQWSTGGAAIGGTVVLSGSLVVDAVTGGVNILATPVEVAGGSALGGGIGYVAGSLADWIAGPHGQYATPPENAYDPDGPKAPGKPGPAEGFEDPKGGESWVKNPNPGAGGSANGWLDSKGRVWCPTGQGGRAHGGPHWDVQDGPGNINVRPGNNINDLTK